MASKKTSDVVSLVHESTEQQITVLADVADTYRSQGWRDASSK